MRVTHLRFDSACRPPHDRARSRGEQGGDGVLLIHGAKDEVVPFAAAETLRAAASGKAVVVPIAGEAFHALDLRYIAPVVWQALDHVVDTPAR